jgi:DNA-binding transcriptional regulator YiaG
VSRQAVQQWLSGATRPSRVALMLAETLCHAPLELAEGPPVIDRPGIAS